MNDQIIAAASGEQIMAEAVQAARRVFRQYGIERPALVINVAWREEGREYAMGSSLPRHLRPLLRLSLEESAEEAG